MLPLFDMFAKMQDGRAMDLLARQYNLSRQQAELAIEALMPAFSQALKRNAADPYGFAGFMQAMASGQHAQYFENPAAAFTAPGLAEGQALLARLFGSKELADAVASHAAQAAGIGQNAMQQMMPAIAAMMMGGLARQSAAAQANTGKAESAENPFAAMMAQMTRQTGDWAKAAGWMPNTEAAASPSSASTDNPFAKMMDGLFGQQPASAMASEPPPASAPANPYLAMWQEMFAASAQPANHKPEPAEAPVGNPFDAFFGPMLESGSKMRDDYQKSVEAMFEQFKPSPSKPD